MKTRLFLAACLVTLGFTATTRAATVRHFTLILNFNTCAGDPNNPNNVICQEEDSTGRPIGKITVTYQGAISDDGTCATNFLCSGTWHESYSYTLEGGTITVGPATAYQGQTPFRDENGFAPIVGFSSGAITGGTGRFQGISGTLTMRWDENVCICLFDITVPSPARRPE